MNVVPSATDSTLMSEHYTPRFSVTERLTARYLVRRYLSRDAVGELYICVDREQSKPVTVKLLHADLLADEPLRRAVVDAARLWVGVEIQGVLPIIDVLDEPQLAGIVTRHVEGTSLEEYLGSYGRLPMDLGASLFRDVAEALLLMHSDHRIHGALCPSNIWIEQRAEQLVPHLRGMAEATLWPLIEGLEAHLNPYLAPELREGHEPDGRCDIYAFGVSLFEALSGQRPDAVRGFDLRAHLQNVNEDLDILVRQSTQRNRETRFQSVMALRNILHEISIEGQLSEEDKRPERPDVGDLIAGQYMVEGMLGEGGMARVYKARDTVMGTQVAVKLLNATCLAEPEVVNRFIDEASIQAQLVHPEPHPNIVAVHRVLREMPVGFVMEFVPGKTLDSYIGNPSLSLIDWLEMFAQICAGLHHAHIHRIIHRDLKPSNILVAVDAHNNRMAKLMDFGISKQLDQPKTRTNLILGTLGYLAPELFISARDASVQSDLYAIGCCMFEALTGQVPFPVEGGLRQLAFRVYNENPPHPSDLGAKIPVELEAIVMMCLNKDPKKRPESSLWLSERLLSILGERDDPALKEAIKATGLKRRGSGNTTLRHYVSEDQLASIRANTGRLIPPSLTGRHSSSALEGLALQTTQGSRRGLVLAIVVVLLVGVGVAAWLLLFPPAPAPPVEPPAPVVQAPTDNTPGQVTVQPAVVLSAADLMKQAEEAAARGDLSTAQALTDQAIATAEQSPPAEADQAALSDLYTRAAELDSKRGDLKRASDKLAKAAEISNDSSILLKKASIDSQRGDLNAAMSSLRKFNQSTNQATDEAARKKLEAEAAAVRAQLLTQTEQLVADAQANAQENPEQARADLERAQQLYNELAEKGEAKRQEFFAKLTVAAEAAADFDRAAEAFDQARDAENTFEWRWKQVELAFKRARYQDALRALEEVKPLATTAEQNSQIRAMAFAIRLKLIEASTGDARLSHVLAAIPLAPTSGDEAPLRQQAFDHYTALATAATAANDPASTLAALKQALPFAPSKDLTKDINKQIKRLESALDGRDKDRSDPTGPLSPDQIQIWIESTPDNARVTIDNKYVGKTPLIRRLSRAESPPKIVIKVDGYYDEALAIDPAAGGHYQVQLKYKPPKIH